MVTVRLKDDHIYFDSRPDASLIPEKPGAADAPVEAAAVESGEPVDRKPAEEESEPYRD